MDSSKKKKSSKKKSSEGNRKNWFYVMPPAFMLFAGILGLFYLSFSQDELSARENKEANRWRVSYWKYPIPFQGEAPESNHPLSRSLTASSCAKCHPQKHKDWNASLHSQAMSPGIMGQYPHFSNGEKASCNVCHAVMREQVATLWDAKEGSWKNNEKFDAGLQHEGITCAACHLRQHQRNGPPLREGSAPVSQAIHGEAQRTAFFETSEFCRGCHQHEQGTMQPGGKPVENTYMEWLQSPAYDSGKTCQSCHMPDRQHMWKGIHDRKMTASGVTIKSEVSTARPIVGQTFKASLKITNTGTGHSFPTYTTPAVFLKAAFLDANGKVVSGDFYEEYLIQRRLNMSTSPWTEFFDTRLSPGESATLVFDKTVPPEAVSFKLWIWVTPDHFYEGFYKTLLNDPTHEGKAMLQEALNIAEARQYSLFDKTLPVFLK